MKKKKFTFRTEKPTGRYRSFFKDNNVVKLGKAEVGSIVDGDGFQIRLRVVKADIMEDGNGNCSWKCIALKKNSASLDEAKEFLNTHIDSLLAKYNLYIETECKSTK